MQERFSAIFAVKSGNKFVRRLMWIKTLCKTVMLQFHYRFRWVLRFEKPLKNLIVLGLFLILLQIFVSSDASWQLTESEARSASGPARWRPFPPVTASRAYSRLPGQSRLGPRPQNRTGMVTAPSLWEETIDFGLGTSENSTVVRPIGICPVCEHG